LKVHFEKQRLANKGVNPTRLSPLGSAARRALRRGFERGQLSRIRRAGYAPPLGRSFERNAATLEKNAFLSSAIRKGEEHAIKDFRPFPYLG
jgi:hypothetical protein